MFRPQAPQWIFLNASGKSFSDVAPRCWYQAVRVQILLKRCTVLVDFLCTHEQREQAITVNALSIIPKEADTSAEKAWKCKCLTLTDKTVLQGFSFGTHKIWSGHHLSDLMKQHKSVCIGSHYICQISFINSSLLNQNETNEKKYKRYPSRLWGGPNWSTQNPATSHLIIFLGECNSCYFKMWSVDCAPPCPLRHFACRGTLGETVLKA